MKIASDLLNVDVEEIDVDEEMTGSGFDIFKLTEYIRVVNETYSLEIRSGIFSEYHSLSLFSQYVCKEYEDVLVGYYLDDKEERTESNGKEQLSLEDIAYTLQVGREEMEERLAVVVSSIQELIEKLTDFSQGETDIEQLYRGNVKKGKTQFESIFKGEEGREFVKQVILNGRIFTLAKLWAFGVKINWKSLYTEKTLNRVSLPTYPFEKKRFWFQKMVMGSFLEKKSLIKLHPMIDFNESTLEAQIFIKEFRKEEFYIRDHVVGHRNLLPGVACLEIARAAGNLANKRGKVKKIKNVLWIYPIEVGNQGKKIDISLYPINGGQIAYKMTGVSDKDNEVIYSQGNIEYEYSNSNLSQLETENIDIRTLKKN